MSDDWIPPPADEWLNERAPKMSADELELELMGILPVIDANESALQAIPPWARKMLKYASHEPTATWAGRCPFCGKPGFYAQRIAWACDACRRNGTVVDFYRVMDGLDRAVALRALVHKCLTNRLI